MASSAVRRDDVFLADQFVLHSLAAGREGALDVRMEALHIELQKRGLEFQFDVTARLAAAGV